MPSDMQFKVANAVHRTMLKLTFGKFGWDLQKMPVVELTTTGRKSGQPRTVMLTSPVRDGDAIVVVASAGGEDQHPAWLLNVRDNPDVEVSLKGAPRQRMRARVATPEERARLWPQVTTQYKGYAGYQTKTTREIPLVLLEPVTGAS
jgi:deazaflavin-dependent oxidoreductase (nitroreductase family)